MLRESVEVSAAARDFSTRLLDRLKWHGVAMVEFKLDERDGVPKLMEINGRFWGSLQLAIDAGVDFPGILVDISNGNKVEPKYTYELGVKTRWLWGDIDSLLMILLKKRATLNLPEGHPGRLRALLDFFGSSGGRSRLEVESLDDIRPALHESLGRIWRRK